MMFSTTVMPPKSLMFWKVRAMWRFVTFSGTRPSILRPSKLISPSSGL